MDLEEFKKDFIRKELEITEDYGKIFSFIDFGNVNNWFADDRQAWDNRPLKDNEFLEIYLKGLKEFTDFFSEKSRIYYGEDPQNGGSRKFTDLMRIIFGKREVTTKDIQKIKHYIEDGQSNLFNTDREGKRYVEIRKCNFDVEISVDAIKMLEHYDTFCIFSGDADFVYLNNFLRKKGKRVIIIKAGYITTKLRQSANLVVNAQRIKQYISRIQRTKT